MIQGTTWPTADGKKQLLHLVFGGELKKLTRHRVPRSRRARHRRHLSRLQERRGGLESQGAGHRRQRPYALFHRASAPAARPGRQQGRPADMMEHDATGRPPSTGRSQSAAARSPLRRFGARSASRWCSRASSRRLLASLIANALSAGPPDQPASPRARSISSRSYAELHADDHRAVARPASARRRSTIRAASGWSTWCRAAPMPR